MSQSSPANESKKADVQVSVSEQRACKIEMKVETSAQMVQDARRNAVKAVNKEITLPGFRKGKAPDELVLKKYPRDVEKRMHKAIADLGFVAAQKIANVSVLNNNAPISFDLKKMSDEGAELLFTFETEPTIPKLNKADFKLKPIDRAEVSEKQIEEAIRQMRYFYAKWTPIADRPIQDGDYIMIDLDTVEGDSVARVFNHIRFEVSKDRMANWMKKLVEGAKSGDVLEGVSEVDEDAAEEEKREFKPKKVRISILRAEGAELPEVNDDFAKKVGAENVEKMRQSVTDLLNKQADEKVLSEQREQVNAFLIENYPFDLPKSLVDTEMKHRITQITSDPNFRKNWDQMSQEERKKLEEKMHEESENAVRVFYLSRQIVQDEKIPVTHHEVQSEAISIYQTNGRQNIDLDKIPREIYALALSKVILAKAQEHILKKT